MRKYTFGIMALLFTMALLSTPAYAAESSYTLHVAPQPDGVCRGAVTYDRTGESPVLYAPVNIVLVNDDPTCGVNVRIETYGDPFVHLDGGATRTVRITAVGRYGYYSDQTSTMDGYLNVEQRPAPVETAPAADAPVAPEPTSAPAAAPAPSSAAAPVASEPAAPAAAPLAAPEATTAVVAPVVVVTSAAPVDASAAPVAYDTPVSNSTSWTFGWMALALLILGSATGGTIVAVSRRHR